MGNKLVVCDFTPLPNNDHKCSKCEEPRLQHTQTSIAYPCSIDDCKCARFGGMRALCIHCKHPLCLHQDPVTKAVVPDPLLPYPEAFKWDLTQRLTSGYSQVNLSGQRLGDDDEMQKLGQLLAAPTQCVRALWLNRTHLHAGSLALIAEWLPRALSLRELYLISNREICSSGTIELFDALPRCNLTALHLDYSMATGVRERLGLEDIAAIITAISRNKKLQSLSLNLPEALSYEQQLALSESIKTNRTLMHLHLFIPPRDGGVPDRAPPELDEPYLSIVGLRLALNRSRGKYIPFMLAFLMGFATKLGGQTNESSLTTLASDALFDRNMIYLVFQFAFF